MNQNRKEIKITIGKRRKKRRRYITRVRERGRGGMDDSISIKMAYE